MSTKLKFKIISCSSQEPQHPVSGLLFGGSEGWQTRRFCTYPQEITLQFYGVVNIRKIQFVSDHRKISSQVDLLYYVPIPNQQQRFYKYGYLQFNRNQQGNARQVKTIMVDINCIYLRLLFHKPYQARDNFFSQIGLQSLSIYGSEGAGIEQGEVGEVEESEAQGEDYQVNEEDQRYINEIVSKLQADKEQAIQQQDYQSANYYKNTIKVIHDLAKKLRQNRVRIQRAIDSEDYDQAKQLKEQIAQQKAQINSILDGEVEEEPQERTGQVAEEEQDNQFAGVEKVQQAGNEFMEGGGQSVTHSRVRKAGNSRLDSRLGNSRPIRPIGNSRVHQQQLENYDQKVIPTLQKAGQKQQEQFGEQKPKELEEPDEVQGKYIKQATAMQEYFDEMTVRKFFSPHWQHTLDALTTIQNDLKTKQKQPGLVRCLVNVVKLSIGQINFQVGILALGVLQQLLKFNQDSQVISKPGDMQNDLEDISRQVLKKLTDNNPKLKAKAEQTFALMTSSMLYGVQHCSTSLTKTKGKLSAKQLAVRLMLLTKLIDQHGLSGNHSVPASALDFGVSAVGNPSDEVRKQAIVMLNAAYRKDKNKTESRVGGLRQNVMEQIRGEAAIDQGRKPRK